MALIYERFDNEDDGTGVGGGVGNDGGDGRSGWRLLWDWIVPLAFVCLCLLAAEGCSIVWDWVFTGVH